MDLQLIFVVEANSKCKSDWFYIKDTIDRFYVYDQAHVRLTPVYMDGKGKYQKKEREISSLIKQYTNASKNNATRKSVVIYCFDCDNYDTKYEDRIFLDTAKKYCDSHGYEFVWFYEDIECVYLGRRVDKGQKKKEAESFRCRKGIENITIKKLLNVAYKANSSNLMVVLDKYLINHSMKGKMDSHT